MTVHEAIAKARKVMDAQYQLSLPTLAQTLMAHDASDEKYERAMLLAKQQYESAVEDGLRRLRAWLQRGGETLQ